MSCLFHQETPKDQFCRHCDSGEHAIHEASRIDWINRCPSCKGSNINTNEIGGVQMVRQVRGEIFSTPDGDRDIITLFSRHSIEEIVALTGLPKARIQASVIRAIQRGEVAAYAPAKA